MVENGAFIKCQGICPLVDISLQKSTFIILFYLLPIEGVDVVLGIDWFLQSVYTQQPPNHITIPYFIHPTSYYLPPILPIPIQQLYWFLTPFICETSTHVT